MILGTCAAGLPGGDEQHSCLGDLTMPSAGDRLIAKLIEKLADRDPRTRRNAAGALRLHGARAIDAVPALLLLLEDDDSRVRVEAERALDRLRSVAA